MILKGLPTDSTVERKRISIIITSTRLYSALEPRIKILQCINEHASGNENAYTVQVQNNQLSEALHC